MSTTAEETKNTQEEAPATENGAAQEKKKEEPATVPDKMQHNVEYADDETKGVVSD